MAHCSSRRTATARSGACRTRRARPPASHDREPACIAQSDPRRMSAEPSTRVIKAGSEAAKAAAQCLAAGGLVAFPTETVYGLGADATNGGAVARLYAAKGRPSFNPLIAHVAGLAE